MQYKIETIPLNSRRGEYNLVTLQSNPLIWKPVPLNTNNKRHRAVMAEVEFAMLNKLDEHEYWENEPAWWTDQYRTFYVDLFSLLWLNKNEDRHSISVNPYCCLTLVQYHNHRLIAYSRSTDMKNGYFSDKLILDYLAECINHWRPDCQVHTIEWFIAVPHVYTKPGIARLLERTKAK
jgi:hypothetical protein